MTFPFIGELQLNKSMRFVAIVRLFLFLCLASCSSDDAESRDTHKFVDLIVPISDVNDPFWSKAKSEAAVQISYFDPNSYLRWRVVKVDVDSFLNGSYADEESTPEHIRIALFDDVIYLVTRTRYVVFESNESAIWEGSFSGTERGRVEIYIVPSPVGHQVVARIVDLPRSFGVTTVNDIGNSHYVIERNPDQPPSIN